MLNQSDFPQVSQTDGNHGQLNSKPRLLDQVREVIRFKHYSIRTEQSYVDWIKRYIYYHNKKHPKDLGEQHITSFLTHLAVKHKVASSTQNQALCAIVFLYREVLKLELGEFGEITWAKRPEKLPVVFTKGEVKQLLLQLSGIHWLLCHILYGSGLRVMECVRLRVKDIDFEYKQIVVRDGKGKKDRVTMLPNIIIDELQRHLLKAKKIHENDLKDGYGAVYLPYALEKKYKNANRDWAWQLFFLLDAVQRTLDRGSNAVTISPKRSPSVPSSRPFETPAFTRSEVAIRFGTRLPPISLNQAMTFERCKNC